MKVVNLVKQLIKEEVEKFITEAFNLKREEVEQLYGMLKFEDDYPSILSYLGEKSAKKLVEDIANNIRKREGRLDALFRKYYMSVNLYNEYEILTKNIQSVIKEHPHDSRLWSSPGSKATMSSEFVTANKPIYKGHFDNQEKEVKGKVEILIPSVNPETGKKVFRRMQTMKRLGAWVWNANTREWAWKASSKPGVTG